MVRIGLLVLIILVSAGCNLNRGDEAVVVTDPPSATAFPTPSVTRTPIAFGITALPTLLPLPGVTSNTAQPTLLPVTSAPALGTSCAVYVTYSGADPSNKLSMRSSASTSAPQVFRVPTGVNVLLVPNSPEMEGDGYHWLNVIYTERETRYTGWIARDSFSTNGVRDPSVATLRPLGATAAC